MAEHSNATDEQILAMANRWAKEPGWMDFETNDFLSCARALIAEFAAPAVVVSAEPVATSHMLPRGWTAGQLDADTFFLKKLGVGAGSFGKNDERARISVVAEFLSEMLATPVGPDAVDARDAARWRRLVNASESPFPMLTIADDPENDCRLVYGRKRLEELVDQYDEIPDGRPSKGAA